MPEEIAQPLRARRGQEIRLLYPAPAGTRPRFLLLVPVYRELDSGNLARLLATAEQAGASFAEVDLFFLVNNSAASAEARDEAFRENQRTLDFLRSAAEGGARVAALDLSTAGFEKNMGKLRQAGLEAWRGRVSSADLARTVVVHLDADVRLPLSLFPRLERMYGAHPDLGAVFFGRDYDLRGAPSAELLFTHHRYRLKKALFDFTNVRTGLSEGLATYQLSARFFAHDHAGGFPPVAKDEDSLFTRALCGKVWWAYAPDLELITEDRTRAEGFNSARRARDLRGLARGGGWFARLRFLKKRLLGGPFAAIEAERPPPPKDFFLQYGLFEPLARSFNEEVRRGVRTFEQATSEYRSRVERVLGAPVPNASTSFGRTPPGELPAEAFVPGTGGSVLPPVAHPLSACLLMPTLTPGTDLRGIFLPHATAGERASFESIFRAEWDKMAHVARARGEALEYYFAGGMLAAADDPFLAWVASSPKLFASIQKKIKSGALSAPEAVRRFTRIFPDYLSEGPSFAYEAALVRALNRALASSYAAPEAGGLEAVAALLKR